MAEQIKAKVFGMDANAISLGDDLAVFNTPKYAILPGFCDVHVHFREPGFSYKETMVSGSASAARGGYTAVCTMPNLNPTPDSVEHLQQQLDLINAGACIRVFPYGSITCGLKGEELSDLEGMAPNVIAYSDDGKGVQSDDMMNAAMLKTKELGKMIVAHCEVNDLLKGGYIHDGKYAVEHGHRGICSESEWAQVARDIELIKRNGCPYHVCHISTKETVDIIRKAKAEGVDITCETGPHYLVMDDSMLQEEGRFKMNPPLRDISDREALVAGILDGTIDMLATDHAPHSAEEKAKGLEKSAFGVVGLETAFPIMYTYLVKPGVMTMEQLMDVMVYAPRKRFNIPLGNDFSIWDLEKEYTVDPADFVSMGKASPFTGWTVNAECVATVCDGKLVWKKSE